MTVSCMFIKLCLIISIPFGQLSWHLCKMCVIFSPDFSWTSLFFEFMEWKWEITKPRLFCWHALPVGQRNHEAVSVYSMPETIEAGRGRRHFNCLTGGLVTLTHILDEDLRREQWTILNTNKTPNEILDNFISHHIKSDNISLTRLEESCCICEPLVQCVRVSRMN